jgi:transcriptional regulator with XRE-family HTH domain
MDEAERRGEELQREIAARIRNLRLEKGWSLDKLSQVTGLSKSYLSQIENCEKTPPVSTLTKIAFGLAEDVITLITGKRKGGELPKFTLVKAGERQGILHRGLPSGNVYESINFRKTDRVMDAYIVTVGPDFPKEPLVHEGQEVAFALNGTQEFIYDGRAILFEKGDCICFDSDRPHMSRSLGGETAQVLVVFSNPLRAK